MKALVIIGAGIAALVVLAVVVVLAGGSRPATTYPADTPEGTFQRYYAAFEEGDFGAAYAFLSVRVTERISFEEYERQAEDSSVGFEGGPARRILFDKVTGGGGRRTLHLTVEEFYGDGLDASRNRYQVNVRMVLEDGAWRIDEPLVGVNQGYFPALPEG
ncbi:MAG: hypothetical protein ACRDGJ_00365 [Candidatus Limnocylindria bacterium]